MTGTAFPQHVRYTRRAALRTLALAIGASALPSIVDGRRGSAFADTPSPSPTPSPRPITSTSLGDKLTMVTGAGGNILLLGGNDGVLMIDSGLPQATEKMLREAAKAGPVSVLVNTHWHFDHVGGNEALAKTGARIMATENCRNRLSSDQYVEPLDVKTPASPPAARPVVTFTNETTLHVNGDTVRLLPVAPAHTDGDVIVRLENADVIHAGDLYFNGGYPFIDWSSGGWLGGLVAAVQQIAALAGPKTRIIPGHGPLATPDDLRDYLRFLETMLERMSKLKAEGKTPDEAVAAAPAKEFDEKLGKSFMKPEQFVRITYTSLLKHQ